MKTKVFIEILPRLSTCYVFIKMEKKVKHLSLKPNEIRLIYDSDDTSEEVIAVDCITLKPDTISSLEFYDQTINFRVFIDRIAIYEPPEQALDISSELDFKPEFSEDTSTSIKCRCCNYDIVKDVKFKRILPLPSGILDRSDFFCHDHPDSSVRTASLSPSDEDCFYGQSYVLIKYKNNQNSLILHCEKCLAWLGTFQNDSVLKLWNCSTILSNVNITPQSISYDSFCQLIRKICVTSFYGSVKVVLESQVEKNETNYLLLWILDDKLVCLTDDAQSEEETSERSRICLIQKRTVKVLYLFQEVKTPLAQNWMKSINITTIDVAKQMFLSALSHLNCVNQKLPAASRKTNNMFLSYLDPIL